MKKTKLRKVGKNKWNGWNEASQCSKFTAILSHKSQGGQRSRYFKSVAFEVRFDIFSLLISDKWRLRSPKILQRQKKIGKVHLHLNNFWQWKFKFRSLEIEKKFGNSSFFCQIVIDSIFPKVADYWRKFQAKWANVYLCPP